MATQLTADDYGNEYYTYANGEKYLFRSTRTHRPERGEGGQAFRRRVDASVHMLEQQGSVEVVEEIRAGSVTQVVVTVTYSTPIRVTDGDEVAAGGRPMFPRGRRGGGR
jgi:hypothetical protein